jgi:chemotaxis protein methyltransferase CheR
MEAPLEAATHLHLGVLYLESGDAPRSIEALRRAAFLSPHEPFIQFVLGRAYLQDGAQGRAQAAFAHARRLISAMPDETLLNEADGVRAGELRGAIDAELSAGTSRRARSA